MNTLYRNGKIYTVDGAGWETRPADAMLVSQEGIIIAVGENSGGQGHSGDGSGHSGDGSLGHSGDGSFCVPNGTQKEPSPLCPNVVDLGGKTVLPGFTDTHVHMPGSAITELFLIDLSGARTLEETLAKVKTFAENHPDEEFYFGSGFYMSIAGGLPEGPRKEWLDSVIPDRPVVLDSSDGHSYWLNSKALEVCGIDENTTRPKGGRIHLDARTGKPSGTITDAGYLVRLKPKLTAGQQRDALLRFQKNMIGWGYTSLMCIAPHMCGTGALRETNKSGEWLMRVNLSSIAEPDPTGKFMTGGEIARSALAEADRMRAEFAPFPLVRVSTVKFFADGVVEGRTAWLREPYAQTEPGQPADFRGEPLWPDSELADAFAEITGAGYQIHVHSVGDAATAQVINALRGARARVGSPSGNRDVLTHLQIVLPCDTEDMKELGIIASHQPFWHFKEPNWYEEIDLALLGRERAEAAYPVGSALRSGVRVTFSGDHPVSPTNNPFWAIQNAVTRNINDAGQYGVEPVTDQDDEKWLRGKGERISIAEAIEAYTINGAWQLFRENETGSLVTGKLADFIVLDKDPFGIPPMFLYSIKPVATFIGGKRV